VKLVWTTLQKLVQFHSNLRGVISTKSSCAYHRLLMVQSYCLLIIFIVHQGQIIKICLNCHNFDSFLDKRTCMTTYQIWWLIQMWPYPFIDHDSEGHISYIWYLNYIYFLGVFFTTIFFLQYVCLKKYEKVKCGPASLS
jgi:hypothetical protein